MRRLAKLVAVVTLLVGLAGDATSASNDFMGKVKEFIAGTPTPAPKKKKSASTTSTKKHSPTPTPRSSASPKPKSAHSPRPSPTRSPRRSPTPSETPEPSPSASPEQSPVGEESPSPEQQESPASSASPEQTPSASPSATSKKSASATPTRTGTAPVSIQSSEIIGYEKYPARVRKVLGVALDLTTRNLSYKYGSDDPASGGMDCSGFIHYVLKQVGMKEVPRDAREQYIWVRKAGTFQAVLGRSPDTFELDDLKPGDLMFWAGTYKVDRDPAITHTMIYLGREKATNQRVMVGASDGRTYKGQSRYGVSVFDFKMAGRRVTSSNEPGPTFVGYGSIPGLEKVEPE